MAAPRERTPEPATERPANMWSTNDALGEPSVSSIGPLGSRQDRLGLDFDNDDFDCVESLSASRFEALSLGEELDANPFSGLSLLPELGSGIPNEDMAADEEEDDDPFSVLEAAIEEDKPKTEATPEWKEMIEAIEQQAREEAGFPNAAAAAAAAVPSQAEAEAEAAAPMEDDGLPGGSSSNGNCNGNHPQEEEEKEEESGAELPMLDVQAGEEEKEESVIFAVGGLEDPAGSNRSQLNAGNPAPAPPFAPSSQARSIPKPQDPSPADAHEVQDALRRTAFAALQPICSRLLTHRSDAPALAALLGELSSCIASLPPAGIQSCIDYVLFPLQMALDGIAAARKPADTATASLPGKSEKKETPEDEGDAADALQAPALPALRSDKAAEAALSTLLTLFQRCRCTSGRQFLEVLQHLSGVLALPRGAASEELRLGALRVAGAVLDSVSSDTALRKALREEEIAPMLGHLLSLSMQVADAEVMAGGVGSKAVRIEALRMLRKLVQAVDDAAALSFFLPGVIIGLARALKAGNRKGASSAAATVEALWALREILVATLGNDAVESVAVESDTSTSEMEVSTAEDAMLELLELSKRGDAQQDKQHQANEARKQPPPLPPLQEGQQARLRVERTAAWLETTAAKIQGLLGSVLPPLVVESRPEVREALVQTSATLLTECSLSLPGCRPFLLDAVFALAQDEWTEVRTAAQRWLHPSEPSSYPSSVPESSQLPHKRVRPRPSHLAGAAEANLEAWLDDLPAALRRGDAAGHTHALKVITCLQTCSPQWIASRLLAGAAARRVAVFVQCFAIDADAAGLLVLAGEADVSAFVSASTGGPPSETEEMAAKGAIPTSASVAAGLPRMPLGLELISTQQTYEAVARVVRTLATVAAKADSGPANRSSGGDVGGSIRAGTALRSLVDACLQQLQRCMDEASVRKKVRGRKSGSSSASIAVDVSMPRPAELSSGGLATPWQLSTAQMVIVLTETLFGASSAWTIPAGAAVFTEVAAGSGGDVGGSPEAAPALSTSPTDTRAAELESLVGLTLTEVVDERIWALPTVVLADGSGMLALPSSSPGFSTKDRGANAMLQRSALDCVGACARALGARFASNSRLTRVSLLPTLEKLGDPCRLVAAAADAAIKSICVHCGFSRGGLRQLVAANADYIVDGLCRQLRQPEAHPRSPQLFAALLRQGGVAPGLVPLLAEPARQALAGVSIMARRQRPDHVLPFVQCLAEISVGAGVVAREAAEELRTAAANVEERQDAAKAIQRELRPMPTVVEIDEKEAHQEEGQPQKSGIDEIADYFASRRANAGEGCESDEDGEDSDRARNLKVPLTSDEWSDIQVARKRAIACATLARSSADAAGLLVLSSSLPVAVQSLGACSDALDALDVASRASELCAKRIEPFVVPPEGVLSPTDANPPALLPSVHLLWAPLIGALEDWRIAVVERALDVLSHLSSLAGAFIAARFRKDAWPVLQRLAKEGPSFRRVIAPGQDDLSSPAVVQRAQKAVLWCLQGLASKKEEEGPAAVMAPVAPAALETAGELLGDGQHPAVREAATAAFVALAGIDPDAAWALIVGALKTPAASGGVSSALLGGSSSPQTASAEDGFVGSNYGGIFMEVPLGFPPLAAIWRQRADGGPKGLRSCGEAKLLALLKQVERMEAPWHAEVGKLLMVCA